MSLAEIIERLEKASDGDRKLDIIIMNLLDPRAEDERHLVMGKLLQAKWGAYGHMANQIEYFIEAPKITASVDVAIALAEKVLPGCNWSIDKRDEGDPEVWYTVSLGEILVDAKAPSLALCLAILKAKQMETSE